MSAQQATRVLQAPATLGLPTREAFRQDANILLDEMAEGQGQLVVDFSGTKEVDSSGLSALVMVHRHAAERRQQIVLRSVGPELEFLLVLTKLDDLFVFARAGS
ncbi:MAG TPA: STAS domain-containing protein [Gemmatimonadales bacterium]|nr:STAS domain-containing protein [Gemmatimonadales bacterium]